MRPPGNERPGAGDAGASVNFQNHAAPSTGNQLPAQANATLAAFDLLNAIVAVGGYVATVDGDILVHVPRHVPIQTREQFYRRLYELKAEVIDLILRKNGVRS